MVLSADRLNASFHLMNVINNQSEQERDKVDQELMIANEQLYMFSKPGDKVDIDLHLRDLVNSNLEKGL